MGVGRLHHWVLFLPRWQAFVVLLRQRGPFPDQHDPVVSRRARGVPGVRGTFGQHHKLLFLTRSTRPCSFQFLRTTCSSKHFCSHTNLHFATDSKAILSSSYDETLRVWDVETGMLQNTLEGHEDGITCCAWAPDAKTCLSGSDDTTLRLWNPFFNQLVRTLQGHSKGIIACCYSVKSNTILSTSWDGVLNAWDFNTGDLQHTLLHPGRCFTCICFSPDGSTFVTGSTDGSLRGV